MCGIMGYHGEGDGPEKVFQGLKKLEYRGYDSAGIAAVGNPSLKVEKGVGEIDEAIEAGIEGDTSIGHTRWATHGEVSEANAHPHLDCSGGIAVVHNGIVNNHRELRKELEGHDFRSETDTEVIPHLLEEEMERASSPRQAAENVMEQLEGSFAVVAALETGELLAFRKNSPLALGTTEDEVFVASDITPFLEHTETAVFLEEGDIAVIDGSYSIYNAGEEVEREEEELEWNPEEASKAGYDHFMQKEIREQSTTVKRAAFQDTEDLEKAVQMMEDARNIYITACGTAGIAASLGAKYLRDAGFSVETELAHELEYRTNKIDEEDLVIAVSQSGETADLLSVLNQTDAGTLAVVNVVGSTLARNSDHTLYVNAGPEIGVASTKAFTAQLAVLKLLRFAAGNRIEEGKKSLINTAEKIDQVIEQNEEEIENLSDYLLGKDSVFFIGRNRGHEMAREAALKLKELSYLHAEAFPGGEFKHGTLALVEDGTPVVTFLKKRGYDEILSNAVEAKGRGADIVAVGSERPDRGVKFFIEIPEDENREILEVVPFQMLAYRTSLKKGNDPDKPRNLAKSITVK